MPELRTLRLAEIKWYCNYCRNTVVQLAPHNPPSECPQCGGEHENKDVERLIWTIGNLLYADKLRKEADPDYRRKT